MIFRHEAVGKLHPNLVTTVGDKSYDSSGNLIVVDEAKVAEENAKLQADYDAKKYQRDRAIAYDPIPEQLDQIYHDIDGWKKRIKSVKDKYPKPSE
tara:strand:+ start:901 stop:1188 length:288 start_codon:yes stop_codon:yes gene_type:complete